MYFFGEGGFRHVMAIQTKTLNSTLDFEFHGAFLWKMDVESSKVLQKVSEVLLFGISRPNNYINISARKYQIYFES